MSEQVTFTTSDNVSIAGSFNDAKSDRAALLVHMMPETKESWRTFADGLKAQGISSLAIDLRGHGESSQQSGGRMDFTTFTDTEHQASAKDVEAAIIWLEQKGYNKSKIVLVGASIGANLILQALGYDPALRVGIALSPGLNYRGVEPAPFVSAYAPDKNVLFVASKDDISSAMDTEVLSKQTTSPKELILLDNAGHGTNMLISESNLQSRILSWITATL